MKKAAINFTQFMGIGFLLVVLDQVSKWISVQYFQDAWVIIPYWLEFEYHENLGVGFSIMLPQLIVEIVSGLVILFGVLFLYTKRPPNTLIWAIVLVLSGALGNLIDRIRLDYVIDFVSHGFWPVYNMADIYICLGLGIWFWTDLKNNKKSR